MLRISAPSSGRSAQSRSGQACHHFLLSIAVSAPVLLAGCQSAYVLSQGWHQLQLGRQQRPLKEVLGDPQTSAEHAEKLKWVPKVLDFCRDELGLDPGDAYTSYLDTTGTPVSYVVTASHQLALIPYRWRFPFVGKVSYKGYFARDDADAEASRLREQGYDVQVSPVRAYSTLGWFKDPVLSTMLEDDVVELIDLLIHETTHRTVYLPDATSFNESLATHIAYEGTQRFVAKHPDLQPLLAQYEARRRRTKQHRELLFRLRRDLDALFRSQIPDSDKVKQKKALFRTASRAIRTLSSEPSNYELPANNCVILGVARYHEYEEFLTHLQRDVGGHPNQLTAYLVAFAQTGQALPELLNKGKGAVVLP